MEFKDQSSGRRPCRYFFSQAGCRYGDACRFGHEGSYGSLGGRQFRDSKSGAHHFSSRELRGVPEERARPDGHDGHDSHDGHDGHDGHVGHAGHDISVMSYNVLADAYANKHRHELYTQIPADCLSWQNRVELLAQEIVHWDPTIVCLQEVDHFADLEDKLSPHGYIGRFLQRTNDRPDGLAMFWKAVVFGGGPAAVEDVKFAGLNLRDNVAQVYRLRMAGNDEPGVEERGPPLEVVVSNIHVLFNPKRGDIKLGQVRVLVDTIDRESGGGARPVIMCGDWNSAPCSGVYDFLSDGRLDFMERDRRTVSGQIAGNRSRTVNSRGTGSSTLYKAPKPWKIDEIATALGDPSLSFDVAAPTTAVLSHDLDLTSSYRHVLGSEPMYTTAHDKYIGTVDYVFFSSSRARTEDDKDSTENSKVDEQRRRHWHIEPRAVLLPPPTSVVLPQGLPRGWFGSDHVSLLVKFSCVFRQ